MELPSSTGAKKDKGYALSTQPRRAPAHEKRKTIVHHSHSGTKDNDARFPVEVAEELLVDDPPLSFR